MGEGAAGLDEGSMLKADVRWCLPFRKSLAWHMNELRSRWKLASSCISLVNMSETLLLLEMCVTVMVPSATHSRVEFFQFLMWWFFFCGHIVAPFHASIVIVIEGCRESGVVDGVAEVR
jgi:hypothetical protein